MANPHVKKVKIVDLDDVDVCWNNTLYDFEVDHVDV